MVHGWWVVSGWWLVLKRGSIVDKHWPMLPWLAITHHYQSSPASISLWSFWWMSLYRCIWLSLLGNIDSEPSCHITLHQAISVYILNFICATFALGMEMHGASWIIMLQISSDQLETSQDNVKHLRSPKENRDSWASFWVWARSSWHR